MVSGLKIRITKINWGSLKNRHPANNTRFLTFLGHPEKERNVRSKSRIFWFLGPEKTQNSGSQRGPVGPLDLYLYFFIFYFASSKPTQICRTPRHGVVTWILATENLKTDFLLREIIFLLSCSIIFPPKGQNSLFL